MESFIKLAQSFFPLSETLSDRTSLTSTSSTEETSPHFEEILHAIRDEKLLFQDYDRLTSLDAKDVAKINQLKPKEEMIILSIFISKAKNPEEKEPLYRQMCGKLIASSLEGSVEEIETALKYVKSYAGSEKEKDFARTAIKTAAKNLEKTNLTLSNEIKSSLKSFQKDR